MEPGHEDREHEMDRAGTTGMTDLPQWNPAMKTGSTCLGVDGLHLGLVVASMEPGHEDREHFWSRRSNSRFAASPQWNPDMKTGSTHRVSPPPAASASRLNGTRP